MHISLRIRAALQHLYYLLGVCVVVTVACQYVHCSLIGKSTFDSSLTQNLKEGHFFFKCSSTENENQLLEKRVSYVKQENQFDCCSFVSVACIDTIDHPSIELVATPFTQLAFVTKCAWRAMLAAGTIFTLGNMLLHSISWKECIQFS